MRCFPFTPNIRLRGHVDGEEEKEDHHRTTEGLINESMKPASSTFQKLTPRRRSQTAPKTCGHLRVCFPSSASSSICEEDQSPEAEAGEQEVLPDAAKFQELPALAAEVLGLAIVKNATHARGDAECPSNYSGSILLSTWS